MCTDGRAEKSEKLEELRQLVEQTERVTFALEANHTCAKCVFSDENVWLVEIRAEKKSNATVVETINGCVFCSSSTHHCVHLLAEQNRSGNGAHVTNRTCERIERRGQNTDKTFVLHLNNLNIVENLYTQ